MDVKRDEKILELVNGCLSNSVDKKVLTYN